MKLILRILLALVVLGVVAVVAVPFLLPSGWIAEKVAEQVKVHTGRTLAFSQDTSLSFFPDIALTLKDARLSNPPDMPEGYVVSMETLRLKVALQPLISRRVEIQEFQLEKPALNLLVTSDGKSNWRLPETAPSAGGKSDSSSGTADSLRPTDITLGPINIDGGRLRYLDERTGTALKIDDINAAISLPKLDGPITIKGNLVWNGEKVALDFKADQPAALAEDRASAVSFTLAAKPLAMGYAGKLSLQQGFHLSGGVNVKTPNLRNLARWVDAPLAPGKGLGPFSVKSSLAYSKDKITLQKATLKLDGMNARGDVAVDLKGAVPFISGRLGVDKIDVNAYTGGASGEGGGGSAASGAWSTANIDMSGLRAVNANLSLNAGNIIYKTTTLSKAVVALTLKGGVLDAKLTNVGLYGGSAAGALRLNGAKKVPSLAGSVRTKGVKAYPLLKDFAGFEWLEGATAITAQVTAGGRSQAAMVSTLAGKMNITFSDGAIRGVNIAKMIRGATKNILSGWEKEPSEKTDFSEFSANFNIAKGIASSNDLKLIGPLVRLTGKGTVSMPPKRLNFLISPKVVASLQGQGGLDDLSGVTVPFKVEGPWANPKIYPDIEGILQNPEQAFQAFNKLLGGKNGIKGLDSKSIEKVVKKKTIEKVTKEIDKVIGEEGTKQLEELGGGLLKNLFKNN